MQPLLSRVVRLTALIALAIASIYAAPMQSPIDIRSDDTIFSTLPPLMFSLGSNTSLDLLNNGSPGEQSTIRANLPADAGTLTVNGTIWPLIQFHFHTESEHTINGVESDMELHMVFQQLTGEYLVVSRLLDAGAFNPILDPIFSNLPPAAGDTYHLSSFDLNGLLPSNFELFRYDGSLTTPPFTEGVNWIVFAEPMELSMEQIDRFRELFPDGDQRDVQPLNGRHVLTDVPGFSSIPEPSTYATAGAGMLLVAVRMVMRFRQSS